MEIFNLAHIDPSLMTGALSAAEYLEADMTGDRCIEITSEKAAAACLSVWTGIEPALHTAEPLNFSAASGSSRNGSPKTAKALPKKNRQSLSISPTWLTVPATLCAALIL